MRKNPLVNDCYYHVYNRGVDKRDIFLNKKDVSRFVLSIKEFNTVSPVGSIRNVMRDKMDLENKCIRRRKRNGEILVSIVCFCINPNHFHFVLRQEKDGGISEFLKRLLGGYSKYFNKVYNRSGALFQGKFRSHLISNDRYLLKILPYVNMNNLIHDIPEEKKHLIISSNEEYERKSFRIVSQKEARQLLELFGGSENFKKECASVVSFVREERGKSFAFLE